MSLTLHTIKSGKGTVQRKQRVGRAGKRGTYSGRGLKGQRSRSGGKSGLKRLGLKALVNQTHKLGGFKSPHARPEIVNLKDINSNFKDGDMVTPAKMAKLGLIRTTSKGVKILGVGKLTKKVTVKNCTMSKTVADQLELKS